VSRDEATQRAAAVPWWLDVETMNSWQTLEDGYGPTFQSKLNDTSALVGAVRALWDEGITRVGIYSTSYQWREITGGREYTRDYFSANPVWLAGYEDEADARSGCNDPSFTGGPVQMTQFLRDGYDANVRCR
jgi:GH25 family lysozyme M1 (1,4-beta-N-acetylmuramidase)